MRHGEKHQVPSRIGRSLADDPITVMDLLPIPLAFWDGTRSHCLINASTSGLIGFSQAELLDNPQLWNKQVQSGDAVSFANFSPGRPSEQRELTCDYRFLPKDADATIWLRETTTPLPTPISKWRFVSTFIDITDLKKARYKTQQKLAGEVNQKLIRGLFHDIKNRLQRLNMEIELAGLEGQIRTELGRNFTEALLAVNHSLTAMHDHLLVKQSNDSGARH